MENWLSHQISRLKTRVALVIIAGMVMTSSALLLVMYQGFRDYALQSARQRLEELVAISALQINGDQHAALKKPSDEAGSTYSQVDAALQAIQANGMGIDSLYTMRMDPAGEIALIVDSSVEEHSSLGTPYEDPGPALVANFQQLDHAVVEDGFYTDQWGTWLSGYAPIYRSDGTRDGVLGIDISADTIIAEERQMLLKALVVFSGVVICSVALGVVFASRTTAPVVELAHTAEQIAGCDLPAMLAAVDSMAKGDLTGCVEMKTVALPIHSKDEIGELTRAFNAMLSGLAQVGEGINRLSTHMQGMIGTISTSAIDLSEASRRLAGAAGQCANASQQIAVTSQEVSRGAAQQNNAVSTTAGSVRNMGRAIDGVAVGAEQQDSAVSLASERLGELKLALEQLARAAQASADGGEAARIASGEGKNTVQNVVAAVLAIHAQVNLSATKMQEMAARSEQIGDILSSIEDIASQTNLLALNAAIETARSESQASLMTEEILNSQMIAQAQLISQFLLMRPADELTLEFWDHLVRRAGIDAVYITDSDGVVVCSNDPEFIGWRFPEEPKEQASVFRKLIHSKDGIVCQKSQNNTRFDRLFKYVGVSRIDQPGIVQIAFDGKHLSKYQLNLAGFGVVASEVRRLAERSTEETKAIATLIANIQQTVSEAQRAMDTGAAEVDAGIGRASQAGGALESIVQTAERVCEEGTRAAAVAHQALKAAEGLSAAMESVRKVVGQNTSALVEMRAESGQVEMAVESIAIVSSQNSAAVEQVSAATEQISAQMEDMLASTQSLAEMAASLTEAVSFFKVNGKPAEASLMTDGRIFSTKLEGAAHGL
jgi:methyl-accepting chemotaxis protein